MIKHLKTDIHRFKILCLKISHTGNDDDDGVFVFRLASWGQ